MRRAMRSCRARASPGGTWPSWRSGSSPERLSPRRRSDGRARGSERSARTPVLPFSPFPRGEGCCRMRKVVLGVAVLAIVAIGCAPKTTTTSAGASGSAQSCSIDSLHLYAPGKLTIATGNPAYKPWYGGDSVPGSDWKSGKYTGDPHTGEGYESAFAYALATRLGFTKDQLQWLGIPFGQSFAPGPHPFDFAMQQISITAKRAQAVDFSEGYYDVNQALIADNGSPAIGVTTLAGLKDLKLGAPVGTTSLQVIQDEV